VNYYATAWRQGIVFTEMKRIIRGLLEMWYV
jgi:hypothetical protein